MASDCPHCDRSFPKKKALEDHLQRAHPGEDPPRSKGPYVIAGLVVLAGLVVAFALLGGGGADGLEQFHVEESPHRGSLDAPIALVAFESPACTSCRVFHTARGDEVSTFDRIQEVYVDTGKVLYVEKYTRAGYPWETVGAMGQKCVHAQAGNQAFFDLTKRFYEQQPQINSGNVESFVLQFAQDAGLDTQAIRACMQEGAEQDALQRDLGDAAAAGVRGTPTFFLVHADGTVEQLPFGGFPSFASAFEEALDKAEGTSDASPSGNGTEATAGNESP